jgi:hypothetical protein
MRAIDCPCGHRLEGADDEELFRLAREHSIAATRRCSTRTNNAASASPRTPTTPRRQK